MDVFDKALSVLKPVGETGSDLWHAAIGDRVTAYRVRNGMKIQKHLHEEARRLGLKLNPDRIPERYLFGWFEEATKQDEDDLQVLFARLLARAADEDNESQPDRRMIDVLSRFTPEDAEVFLFIYRLSPSSGHSDGLGLSSFGKSKRHMAESLLLRHFRSPRDLALDHLITLGCLAATSETEMTGTRLPSLRRHEDLGRIDLSSLLEKLTTQIHLIKPTILGRELYQAVRPDPASK